MPARSATISTIPPPMSAADVRRMGREVTAPAQVQTIVDASAAQPRSHAPAGRPSRADADAPVGVPAPVQNAMARMARK